MVQFRIFSAQTADEVKKKSSGMIDFMMNGSGINVL